MQWTDKAVKSLVFHFGELVMHKVINQIRDEIETILNSSQDLRADLKSWLEYDEFEITISQEDIKTLDNENSQQ